MTSDQYDESQAEWERLHRHAREAVELADTLGIYAVPVSFEGKTYWRPRTAGGCDPDLGWLLDNQPSNLGWLSWADAVVAHGNLIKGKQL